MKVYCFLSIFLIQYISAGGTDHKPNENIHVMYQWIFADFLYPSKGARSAAIVEQQYIPQNVAILDSDYYTFPKTSKKRFFVTTPQFRDGIPATVSEVTEEIDQNGHFLLKPFPSWNSPSELSCDDAISVYRIHIDRCGLLWVLDSGRVNIFETPSKACPPKVLIYDLNNDDKLIERYEFPDGTLNDQSNLITLVTESYKKDCRDSIAYIADVNGFGLVVFDLEQRKSWRIDHKYFHPFPDYTTMTVANVTFDLQDGVFGLALGPGSPRNRKLYFHSLASVRETWIRSSILKNTAIIENPGVLTNYFTMSKEARPGQSTLEVMTNDGILLFALLPQNAIACWNSATPFTRRNLHIIYQDNEKLQFISGMKLKGKNLLVTSSRLQNYIVGKLDNYDVKYRVIIIQDVYKLIAATSCMSHPFGEPPYAP